MRDQNRRSSGHPLETEPELVPEKCVDRETIREADTADLAERSGLDETTVGSVLLALADFEFERKPWRDPRVLARLYYDEGLNQPEIGEHLGTSQRRVSKVMKWYNIAPSDGRPEQPPLPDVGKAVDGDVLQRADAADLADRAGTDRPTVEQVLHALAEFECERKPWRDPRLLGRLYYHEGLTQTQIGDRLSTVPGVVSKWMRRYDMGPGKNRGRLLIWSDDGPEAAGGEP